VKLPEAAPKPVVWPPPEKLSLPEPDKPDPEKLVPEKLPPENPIEELGSLKLENDDAALLNEAPELDRDDPDPLKDVPAAETEEPPLPKEPDVNPLCPVAPSDDIAIGSSARDFTTQRYGTDRSPLGIKTSRSC
jgi:hypothetical protein